MIWFWIEGNEGRAMVCSNLHKLDLSKVTLAELVKLCIQKHEFIYEAVKNNELLARILKDGGQETCALCLQFVTDNCEECPVRQITGYRGCWHTPYDDYVKWGAAPGIVKAEIEFLYSILEEVLDGI